jgi:PAS domain S-box-containing protein
MESKTIRVLAIDDNPDNLTSLKALIQDAFPGAVTLTALNGTKGVELAAAEDPDVILLDVVMPGMDGFEVCKKLKANQKLCDIPVVFLTALRGDPESRIRALECGGDAFLPKPLDKSELTAQIRAMLKVKKSNMAKLEENERLTSLVAEQYMEITETQTATLNLLEEVSRENEARKVITKALQESEEKYRVLFNTFPLGITISDSSGNIVEGNARATELLGLSIEEHKARRIDGEQWCLIRPDGTSMPAEEYPSVKALKENRLVENVEMGIVKMNNETNWINVTSAPLHLENFGVVITYNDITKRKRAEEALLLEKENFRHSLDNSPLGVRIVSGEGHTIYANQTLLEIYGYKSLKELQTTPLKERYTNESYIEAQKRKIKREGGRLLESTYEISIVRKNGESAHLKVHRKKVLWDGIWQFQVIYEDITNSRKREKELEESREQLAQLNLYLQKIKEEERRHIARELHDELGQALTSIKIDLGNLKMYTGDNNILKSRIDKTTELVSDSIGCVKRLTSELRPHMLDDLGLISAIKWYTSEYEQRTGIRISLEIDEQVTYEKKTELIIFRILQESLTNIARHSQAKNTIIRLSESAKGKLIEIKDNGIGFSTTATKHVKSFGLLNMKERAKEIGCTLVVQSEPGNGTTVRLLKPKKK